MRAFSESTKELGDIDCWLRAEERWLEDGVIASDFLKYDNGDLPFDNNISETGIPIQAIHYCAAIDSNQNAVDYFLNIIDKSKSTSYKEILSNSALDVGFRFYGDPKKDNIVEISPEKFQSLLETCIGTEGFSNSNFLYLEYLESLKLPKSLDHSWINLFNWIGTQHIEYISRPDRWIYLDQIIDMAKSDPNKYQGLFKIIIGQALRGHKIIFPKGVIQEVKCTNDLTMANCLLMKIAIDDWKISETEQFAKAIVQLAKKNQISEYCEALELLTEKNIDQEKVESLVHGIYDLIDNEDPSNRMPMQFLLDSIEKLIDSKKSNICHRDGAINFKLEYLTKVI